MISCSTALEAPGRIQGCDPAQGSESRLGATPLNRRHVYGLPLPRPRLTPTAYDMVDAIEPLAKEKGRSLAAFALAWVMNQPGITSPITGPEKLSDIEDSLSALDVTITDDDRAIIDAVNAPAMMASPFYDPILRPGENQFRPHRNRV